MKKLMAALAVLAALCLVVPAFAEQATAPKDAGAGKPSPAPKAGTHSAAKRHHARRAPARHRKAAASRHHARRHRAQAHHRAKAGSRTARKPAAKGPAAATATRR